MPRSASPTPRPVNNTRSTILNHSIAPFYACYLLRSINPKRTATYIGSTPDPPRRIREHNGELKGGAFKTRLLRPWEQELIVYNFPTKLQALQFEWAWQNPERSRVMKRVVAEGSAEVDVGAGKGKEKGKGKEASTTTKDKDKTTTKLDGRTKAGRAARALLLAGFSPPPSPSTSRPRTKPSTSTSSTFVPLPPPPPSAVAQFPRSPLSNRPLSKTQVLQYMLTIPPWSSFPLRVLLFSKEARSWWDEGRERGPEIRTEAGWRKWCKTTRQGEGEDAWGVVRGKRLDEVRVDERFEGVDGGRRVREGEFADEEQARMGDGWRERIRVDDDLFFDPHWAKWQALMEGGKEPKCAKCGKKVDVEDHLSFLLCTSGTPPILFDTPASPPSSTSLPPLPSPCRAVFHLPCLATSFLSSPTPSPSTSTPPAPAPNSLAAPPLLPTSGECPSCGHNQHWQDLLRGAYRRKEETEGVRKKRRGVRKVKAAAAGGKGGSAELEGAEEEEGEGKKKKARGKVAVGKGKGKGKATPSDSEMDDDDERFDLTDVESDVDLDLQQQEEERERAWALQGARVGAVGDGDGDGMEVDEEEGFYDAAEEDDDGGVLFYPPTQQTSALSDLSEEDLPAPSKSKAKQSAAPPSRLAFTSSKPSSSILSSVGKPPPRPRVASRSPKASKKVKMSESPRKATSGSVAAGTGGEKQEKEKEKVMVMKAYIEISDSD